ncbi:hypothetical protein SEA_STARCEVICH_25 [Mycobacterium phage Starcevich]|nr:hypothetical protein SEA_STARCEVICH_25 [Mycobacterium phage Starcevich]
MKVWNGTAFVDPTAFKVWNGSAFVDPELYTWNGTSFDKIWPSTPAPTVQYVGGTSIGSSGSPSLGVTAGTEVGDRVFGLLVSNSSAIGGWDAPAGWTTVNSSGQRVIAYRDFDGSWSNAQWGFSGNSRGLRVYHFTLRRSHPSYSWKTPTVSAQASDSTSDTSFSLSTSGFTVDPASCLIGLARLNADRTTGGSALVVNGQSSFTVENSHQVPKGSSDDGPVRAAYILKTSPNPGSGTITWTTTLSGAATASGVFIQQAIDV